MNQCKGYNHVDDGEWTRDMPCRLVAVPGDSFCPRHRFLCDNTPLDTRTDAEAATDFVKALMASGAEIES